MNRPIIIGAGISGLSAANHLVDNNIYPIIIEANSIVGQTKVCGEFFSYETIPFLEKWGINFILIEKANFIISNEKLKNSYFFSLPVPAASSVRSICESELAKRAVNLGATLYTGTFVQEIIPAISDSSLHYLKLSSGEILTTNKLIITTAKLYSQDDSTYPAFDKASAGKSPQNSYMGIKAHFTNITMEQNILNMFIMPNTYLGVTHINNNIINISCLAQKSEVEKYKSPDIFIESLIKSNNRLYNLLLDSKRIQNNWLTIQINKFGKKNIPNWPNTYFIGDAIASIFPASGNGLAMGLTAGVIAANHIILNSKTNFKSEWNLKYNKRLYYAQILHELFISPYKAKIAFKFAKLFPLLPKILYKLTRD